MRITVDPSMNAAWIRRLSLERSMIRVRWFGIALGAFQIVFYEPRPGTVVPPSARPLALAALAVLLAMNLTLTLTLRRPSPTVDLRRIGWMAFLVDVVIVYAIVWIFNFEELGQTWVVLTVLCLEGALRSQMRGAMFPVALAAAIEPLREYAIGSAYATFRPVSLAIHISDLTYRVGILAMVGSVAGVISRNLEHARVAAEERAAELSELADRESDARRESAAFQKIILAGVQAQGMDDAIQTMIEQIAADLGYERLAVLLRGDDSLSVVALHGFGEQVRTMSAPIEGSIAGQVATSGVSAVVPDVRSHPSYLEVDHRTRSQVSIPIMIGTEVAGVLDVESDLPDAFDDDDVRRLERLCDQMALVMENARLLSAERQTVERLRHLDALKTDFVAVTSHELRTPLTSLKGAVNTLISNGHALTREQTASMLEILGRQSERLTRLVEDLLSVSQLDASSLRMLIEPTDLREVIADVLELFGEEAGSVRVKATSPIPPAATDSQRLGQVLRNLIENALKFSPPGGSVEVEVRSDGEDAIIEVADSGEGIPEDELPNIFDRFYQVGGSMRRRSEGLGLGLYISQRLIDALGGTIAVRSTPGQGTTFTVRLPLA